MVPTPSQLSGPLSHYKKFWILQTQLADGAASSSLCHIPPAATAATAAVNNSCDHSNNIQLHRHSCSTTTSASSSKQLGDAWKLPKQETFLPASDGAPRISSGRLFSDDKGVIISSGCGSTLTAAAPFNAAHVREQYDHRLFNPSCAAASSPFIYTDSSSYSPTNFIFDKPGEAHSIDTASDELINPLNVSEESINLSVKYVRSGMKLAAWAASDRSSSPDQSSQEYEYDRDGRRQDECDEYDDEVNVDQRQQLGSSGFYFTPPGNNSIPSTTATISAGSSLQSRSCTLCGTTKTPLWRSGPQGPKSLCNACGIRVKKAKRLQEAAAAAERMSIINGSAPAVIKTGSASLKPLLKKRKLSEHTNAKERSMSKGAMKTVKQRLNIVTHHKKVNPSSSYINTAAKHGSDSLSQIIESNQGSGSARSINMTKTYAKDEEEAAVLLMALSCGLVLA